MNNQRYAKTINLLHAGNKVFVTYQTKGGVNPPPVANALELNTFCFILYAYFLTWCTHANTVIKSYLYIVEHIGVAGERITSKNPNLTRFFIIKPRNPTRLKK